MLARMRFLIAAALVLGARPAYAVSDAEFEAMRVRLMQLDAEVRELKKERARDRAADRAGRERSPRSAGRAPLVERPVAVSSQQGVAQPPIAGPGAIPRSPSNVVYPTSPPTLTTRVAAIEERLKISDQRSPFPLLTGYRPGRGVTFGSPDDQFQVRLGGFIQFDSRTFADNQNLQSVIPDQFLVRSARFILESRLYTNFSTRLMYEFSNSAPAALLDAYADYNASPAFNIRGGKAKDPLGIERLQNETNVSFVERGMTTNLVPFRDIGLQVYGSPIPQLDYQVGFVDGAPDLVNPGGASDNPRTGVTRVFARPFVTSDVRWLKGLSVGAAGSYGRHAGSTTANDLTAGYVTPGQARFFTYSSTAFARGQDTRVNPQLTYYNGPFSVIGEYVREYQDVATTTTRANLQNDAFMVLSTYVVTGEDARFDGVVPLRNFDPLAGTWGAVEVAGRYSELRVDKGTFPIFANPTTAASQAQEAIVGVNWYLNPAIKLQADFAYTRFKGGATTGDRPAEKAILTRAQVVF